MTEHTPSDAERDQKVVDEGIERAQKRDDYHIELDAINADLRNPYLAAWERTALEARVREMNREAHGADVLFSSGGVMRARSTEITPALQKQIAAVDAELEALPRYEQGKRLALIDKKLALFEGRK